jgi:putative membrane protein
MMGLLGLGVLGWAWFGPLPLAGSFSVHMTRHMAIVAIAAPALALALARTRLDPVTRAPALFAPVPASFAELLVVWLWHTPWLHHVARISPTLFALEQLSFLTAGLYLWLSAVGGTGRDRRAQGVLALLLTSMHMTLLGALLALSPRALYPTLCNGPLTPLEDQHLGGAIMLVVGGAAYLLGGLALTARVLATRTERAP